MRFQLTITSLPAIAIACALSLTMAQRSLAAIMWDFDVVGDDGATTDGWTEVQGFTAPSGSSPPIAPGGRSAAIVSGGSAAGDTAHPALIFRSPTFYLDGSGPLQFDLAGGQGAGSSPGIMPTSPAVIPLTTSGSGVQGIALLDVLTNTYVLTFQKPVNSDSWATYSWTVVQLLPYANDGRPYAIDHFDYKDGGWGHVEVDDFIIPASLNAPVPIPEPSTITLLGLGAIGLAVKARRRRAAA